MNTISTIANICEIITLIIIVIDRYKSSHKKK